MNQKINLKEIEKRAFRSTFQDGLWDIYLGVLLLMLSIIPGLVDTYFSFYTTIVLSLSLAALSVTGFYVGKKYFTAKRIGFIRFGTERKYKLRKMTGTLIFSALGLFILFILSNHFVIFKQVPAGILVFGLICILVFSAGAYFLNCTRFIIWGILYALPLPLLFILRSAGYTMENIWVLPALPGLILVTTGLFYLIFFLRKYPKPIKGGSPCR